MWSAPELCWIRTSCRRVQPYGLLLHPCWLTAQCSLGFGSAGLHAADVKAHYLVKRVCQMPARGQLGVPLHLRSQAVFLMGYRHVQARQPSLRMCPSWVAPCVAFV